MIKKLQWLLPQNLKDLGASGGLKARAARGSLWLGAGTGIEQALRLLRNMILARLLVPEAFGAMAIVLAVSALFESFTDVGIELSVIQNPRGEEPQYLNGAWWLSVSRAATLYGLVFFAAPWVARFYHNPELVPLMRVAFLSTLLNGALSPRAYVAHKRMDFKRWVTINQGGAIFGIVTGVVLAFTLRNIWALVLGFTGEAAARCLLSFFVCPFRPGFAIHHQSLQHLFRFARGVAGLPLLTFIFMRADVFVIGKVCSAAELGLYSMASGLAQMPFDVIARLMGQIAGPAFSEMQSDPARLRSALLKVTSAMVLLVFPLVFYVALYGKDLLLVVYGRTYARAAIPFAILFGTAVLRGISVPVISLYFMIGRPELHRYFTVIRTILILTLIYPATKWYGLTGAAVAGLFSMGIGYAFQIARLQGVIGLDLRRYGRTLARASAISLAVAAVWVATYRTLPFGPLTQIAIGAVGCLLGYALAFFLRVRSKAVFQF